MQAHRTTLFAACSLVLAASGAGCSSCADETDSSQAIPSAPSGALPRPPSPRARDPAWTEARGEVDPLVYIALAEREGATGLVEGVRDGGQIRSVALRALPYAADADLALGTLGELAASAPDEQRKALLEAVVDIAGRPRQPRELLDPEGVKACAARMVELSRRDDLSTGQRALAITATRRLGEKGYVGKDELSKLGD